jgi:hypothetical protein
VSFPYRQGQTPVYGPKPAYLAAKTLATQLAGFAYNKRLAQERADDFVLLFTKTTGQSVETRLAAWTSAKDPHDITIPASPGAFTVINHTGDKTSAIEAAKNSLTITLTDAPQYLLPQKPNAHLRAAALWQRVPPETFVKAPALAELPGAAVPVERGQEPQRVRTHLTLGDAVYAQETVVAPSNPIRVEPLPVTADTLVFDVQNPTGEPFIGEIRLQRVRGLELADWTDKPINLEAGQISSRIAYPVSRVDPTYEVQFEIWRNRRGDRVHAVAQPTITRTFPTAKKSPATAKSTAPSNGTP